MARSDRVKKGITKVIEKRNITTGKQMNIRFTSLDDDALDLLLEKVQVALPQKNITKSKVLRAVGYLNQDDVFINKIIHSIKNNT
jgi:hypothetical protein